MALGGGSVKGPKKGKRGAQNQGKKKNSNRRRGNGRAKGNGADLPFAPNSLAYKSMPDTLFTTKAPSRPGAQARYVGCDYIGPVFAGTSTGDLVNPIDPDNATTFPRLSSIATVFGKYIFNSLRVCVVGKAASTLGGTMTSVPVYEGVAAGAGALTPVQARNRESQVTSKFWENHVCVFDCNKQNVKWFEMASDVASDTVRFGYYHFITEAIAATTPVADLFIEYDIELCESRAVGDSD